MQNHSKPIGSHTASTLAHYLAAKFSKLTPMFLYRMCCFVVCASISAFIGFTAFIYAQHNAWASIPAWGWLFVSLYYLMLTSIVPDDWAGLLLLLVVGDVGLIQVL